MKIQIVKSKIHRVKVTGADLNYIGSITIDQELMNAGGNKYDSAIHMAGAVIAHLMDPEWVERAITACDRISQRAHLEDTRQLVERMKSMPR